MNAQIKPLFSDSQPGPEAAPRQRAEKRSGQFAREHGPGFRLHHAEHGRRDPRNHGPQGASPGAQPRDPVLAEQFEHPLRAVLDEVAGDEQHQDALHLPPLEAGPVLGGREPGVIGDEIGRAHV